MRLDHYDLGQFPGAACRTAAEVEAAGFGGCWFAEVAHNPFVSCATATQTTSQITLGTAIALAFPRSPMAVAQEAWDLAEASGGRFVLGLGTQVKRHIEQRFSVPYTYPLPRLREYVAALRVIFDAFQTQGPLQFDGDFYSFSLLPPTFSPGPIDTPEIPIYVAGVNRAMARMAGEVADGFIAHPLHSKRYLAEVIMPAIAEGLAAAGRASDACTVLVPVFMGFYEDEKDRERLARAMRAQIAFYGSTRTYRAVFDLHGWDDLPQELHQLQAANELERAAALVSEEQLAAFGVLCHWNDAVSVISERYSGLIDQLMPYPPPVQRNIEPEDAASSHWAGLARTLAKA
jgi:probable F420-dependent oxidoreductase